MKQLVRPESGAIQVDPAVVIEVTRCDAHTVGAPDQTAPLRDVREAQRARPIGAHDEVVPVQAVRQRPRTRRRDQGLVERFSGAKHLALHQVDVEVAVVVEVEHRAAGAHDLADVELAGHPVEVHEVYPRLFGSIGEPRFTDWRCCRL